MCHALLSFLSIQLESFAESEVQAVESLLSTSQRRLNFPVESGHRTMCYLALQETEGLNASSPDLHQSLMSSKEVTKTDHPVSKKNCLNLNVALDINGEPLVPVSSISKIAPKRILLNLNVAFDIITKTSGKIGPNKKFQKWNQMSQLSC
ncbi:hypothetical protein MJO28_006322 [Puccinia striiformis f. sp. tritici]|uniref:Uncharacterized protein n=1 Tax=Puccinia striiformis f. sp. tritici TaxID=168172 RepID=A0ACC0EHJ0_9BASI|nr:hypothetical protein MJO28_006322 [Puccinia striiformis f. sp. tritici]